MQGASSSATPGRRTTGPDAITGRATKTPWRGPSLPVRALGVPPSTNLAADLVARVASRMADTPGILAGTAWLAPLVAG